MLPDKEDDHVTVTLQYILVYVAAAALVAIVLTVVVFYPLSFGFDQLLMRKIHVKID